MKKLFTLICSAAIIAGCSDSDDEAKKYITVDFEDVPASLLAVDEQGSNFYSGYGDGQYTEYTDTKSGLKFGINPDNGQYDFWNGGIGFSSLNTDRTIDWTNQCTVDYTDPATGYGGYNGSKVFGVVFSAYDPLADSPYGEPTALSFPAGVENIIDHLWVANSAYVALTIENGNSFARKLTYEQEDYFYVTITGYSAAGTGTGSVNYCLADFRTPDAPGISKGWNKVDLSTLGAVNRIEFTFGGSDVDHQGYGLNTPKYVCIDNIAIKR
ncbi:MAG: DUF4465 domain-containing protein [Rikenellaceae bacterium]|nr:DUF4465 domain-containing protein [Rikenellaceae bacterium]